MTCHRPPAALRLFATIWFGSACAVGSAPRPELAGALLPKSSPRPDFALTATGGSPYHFFQATSGRLTLLYFGYLNCPDVCPATAAILGAAMAKLTSDDRSKIDLIFVTTDPERDSAAALGAWLGKFDREFIGLTGTPEQIALAERAVGIAPAIRDTAKGQYTVSHAAQVIVYSPDDSTHIAYPFGVRQQQWVADLPILLQRWTARDR